MGLSDTLNMNNIKFACLKMSHSLFRLWTVFSFFNQSLDPSLSEIFGSAIGSRLCTNISFREFVWSAIPVTFIGIFLVKGYYKLVLNQIPIYTIEYIYIYIIELVISRCFQSHR